MIFVEKPFGFVYETTNTINDMKYIGKCIYGRINNWETYVGSGLYLKRAIKKYGKEKFVRVILVEAYSDIELNQLEEHYISKRNAVESKEYSSINAASVALSLYSTTISYRLDCANFPGYKRIVPKSPRPTNKHAAYKCQVNDIVYESIAKAAMAHGISTHAMRNRMYSRNFPDHHIIVE